MMSDEVAVRDIHRALRFLGGFGSICIPEFTWGGLRIDALIIDVKTRWARGFEIKISRGDFLRDEKWHLYSQFCSSLSVACPVGLINKEEVPDTFGLLYVDRYGSSHWAKRPKRFQRRDGMAWIWTYLRILETELPRMNGEIESLKRQIQFYEQEIQHDSPASTDSETL